jgi:hypothetical protein
MDLKSVTFDLIDSLSESRIQMRTANDEVIRETSIGR